MQKKHLRLFLVLILPMLVFFFLSGCNTSGMYYKASGAWSLKSDTSKFKKIKLGTIKVDKPGSSLSIEKEISQILPLLFLEHGYVFTNETDAAFYIVDVCATEREFFANWNTKKSVTMEVLLWDSEHKINDQTDSRIETPLAAGRIIAQGSQGLSASNNLNDILKQSIRKAVKKIRK
ncbi:MAG: hypothetical protein LBV52_06930 [Spirochaetaceae bacterium]|nr:hypothetical protein [Spirochaetaceae bacterium]